MKPQEQTNWPVFKQWARINAIPFNHEDDWMAFWETWNDGFQAGVDSLDDCISKENADH